MLDVMFTWKCDFCGKVKNEMHEGLPYVPPPTPGLPKGWLYINWRICCNEHVTKFLIDNEALDVQELRQ